MKIEYINHASLLITTCGKKILTDPWLIGPSWAQNEWLFPQNNHEPEYFNNIDYLYISHGHEDHLHKESIDWLPNYIKKIPLIIPLFDSADYFVDTIKEYGLENYIMLKNNESINLDSNIFFKMFINQSDHDSSLLIESEETSVFLQTDNLLSNEESLKIGDNHKIDICFTITCLTGPFPGFYNMSKSNMMKAVEMKKKNSQNFSLNIVKNINPKYVVPYASDICYFGEDFYANELHRDDKQMYKKLVEQKSNVKEVLIMNPHDSIIIEKGNLIEKNISLKNVQNNIGYHYFRNKDYVEKIQSIRAKDNIGNLEKYVKIFYNSLSALNNTWNLDNFNVFWEIKDSKQIKIFLEHSLGKELNLIYKESDFDYDLKINLDLYRLKHLIYNKYEMGFLSLWNGGFKCERNSIEYTALEKNFWDWILSLNFNFY
mgnify:CR=1 FL=1